MTDFETTSEKEQKVPAREADFGADWDIIAYLEKQEGERKEKYERDLAIKRAESGEAAEGGSEEEILERKKQEGRRMIEEGSEGQERFSETEWDEELLRRYFVPSDKILNQFEEAGLVYSAANQIFAALRKSETLDNSQMQMLALALDLESDAESSWKEARDLEASEKAEFVEVGRKIWMDNILKKRAAKLGREVKNAQKELGRVGMWPAPAVTIGEASAIREKVEQGRSKREKAQARKAKRDLFSYGANLERARGASTSLKEKKKAPAVDEYIRLLAEKAIEEDMPMGDFNRLRDVLVSALQSPDPEETLKDALIMQNDPGRKISQSEYQELEAVLRGSREERKEWTGQRQRRESVPAEIKVLRNKDARNLAKFIESARDIATDEAARLMVAIEELGDSSDFMQGLKRLLKDNKVTKRDYDRIKELKKSI